MTPGLRARPVPLPRSRASTQTRGPLARSARPHHTCGTHCARASMIDCMRRGGPLTHTASHSTHARSRDTVAVCHIHCIRVQHMRAACRLDRLKPLRRPGRGSRPDRSTQPETRSLSRQGRSLLVCGKSPLVRVLSFPFPDFICVSPFLGREIFPGGGMAADGVAGPGWQVIMHKPPSHD
jgi:hypothetical protein